MDLPDKAKQQNTWILRSLLKEFLNSSYCLINMLVVKYVKDRFLET